MLWAQSTIGLLHVYHPFDGNLFTEVMVFGRLADSKAVSKAAILYE